MPELSKSSQENLIQIRPELSAVIIRAVKDCPIPFIILKSFRTDEEQKQLYDQGRTMPGSIITNCDGYKSKSKHQAHNDGYSWAIDFCPLIEGKVNFNDISNFKIIANHILDMANKLGIILEWGGNWKNLKDYCHIEFISSNAKSDIECCEDDE